MGGYSMGFSPDALLGGESEANLFSFMKPPEMLGDLSMPTEYHCSWLNQTEAAVTIVSRPNSVEIDVLDYSRGSFYTVPLGPAPGQSPDPEIASAPGAEARDGDPNGTAPTRWQRWAMITNICELSDGRVALMQNDGHIRVLEFREKKLLAKVPGMMPVILKSLGGTEIAGEGAVSPPSGDPPPFLPRPAPPQTILGFTGSPARRRMSSRGG